MSFARFPKSSMSLFKISIITATSLSIGNDEHKFTKSKEDYISLGDIFHSFAFSINGDEFKLCDFSYL